MSLVNVINQLRLLPVLSGNVSGAANIPNLENFQSVPEASLPFAYVVPLEETAGDNESMTATWQTVTERIGIIVIMSNKAGVISTNDRRGYQNATQFDIVKFSIFKAILNWNPYNLVENPDEPDTTDPVIGHAAGQRGFRYEGSRMIDFDLARLVYQFNFAIDITITDSDGWQATGVPLQELTFTLVDPVTGDTLGEGVLDDLQDVDLSFKGVSGIAVAGALEADQS